MPTVTERIEQIVMRRSHHLPKIQAKVNHLYLVERQLDALNSLSSLIKKELQDEEGEYYALLANDLEARRALSSISLEKLTRLIGEQKSKLGILQKRFERKTIRIAMIGFERQGKSTFLKTISGLKSDKVIPAYSGDSCTGAVSVIHNVDEEFRVEIAPFTIDEFLAIAKEKLKKFFPNRVININSPVDLQTFDLSGFSSSDPILNAEFKKFKKAYCEHSQEYISLLGQGLIILTDENEVVKHVAQYERFDTPPEDGYDEVKESEKPGEPIKYQKNYYKYVAVKHVDIYKRFESIDSRQIELVDTVGLGDASNADLIEKEMFRVLREDCDAAIDVMKPDPNNPGINQVQLDILQKIRNELEGRHPYLWIVYVINKDISAVGFNVPRCTEALQKFGDATDDIPEKDRPVAWAKIINGIDDDDVRGNLVSPLLDLITHNLDVLDDNLMNDCKEKGDEIFAELCRLYDCMRGVIANAMVKALDEGEVFDKRMTELINTLNEQLLLMVNEEYKPKRNLPQEEIEDALNDVIRGLDKAIPALSDVKKKVAITPENSSDIYDFFCDVFINNIVKSFELVDQDIIETERDKVRDQMIRYIYEYAQLKKIVLTKCKGDKIQKGDKIHYVNWLSCLMEEKLQKESYPHLYEALSYALTYDFDLGYSIEYDVSECLNIIDRLDEENFIRFNGKFSGSTEQKAGAIVLQMYNRLPELKNRLRKIADKYSRIPSYSFYTRVHNFVMKICRDEQVGAELKKFCRKNAVDLMGDELSKVQAQDKKLKDWNQMCVSIWELCNRESF